MMFGKMWSKVKTKMDFIQWLGLDLSIKVLTYLDDPCDLVRVSAVSRSWYRFVIENGLCKQLCFKMCPEISDVVHSIEVDDMIEPVSNMLEGYRDWECLKRSHKAYAVLAFDLTPYVKKKNCISKTIAASSTNNYPEESILNALEPGEGTENRASYWLSEGHSATAVPETLVYKLCSKICLIAEIRVQPFQACFQDGSPIYSAEAIRFRIGHPRHLIELESAIAHGMASSNMVGDTQFVWTYTSPYYRMLQENRLQEFKLPEPALCIGGVLLVEMRKRVQRRGLYYYIGISHVQVVGLPISPAFDVKIRHPSGKYTLKYCSENRIYSAPSSRSDSSNRSCLWSLTSSISRWDVMLWMHCLVLVLALLLLIKKLKESGASILS